MNLYIGADLGTSSLKLMLVDTAGKIHNTVTKEYDVHYPKIGFSEQSPEDWWEAFMLGIKELIRGFDKKRILGIGVGGQMHGLVALDKDDNVIRPAILWNDGRASAEVAYLNEKIGKAELMRLTANIAFAGFTAPKILWLRNNEPDSFAKISKIMLPKDYINFKLTGSFVTDYSDASGFLLLDVKNKEYSGKMLEFCGINEEMLPKLHESFDKVGVVKPTVAEELGLDYDVTVIAGAGDNAAAAVGTGTVGNGKCNISLGTSGTVFISSDKFSCSADGAIHSFCHSDGGYHLMGCILSAASCNKWFCDNVLQTNDYGGESAKISEELLGKNPVFFLPYLMGERSPINDTDASGMFIGLNPETSRSDMLLAVLEGVAFAIRDNLECVCAEGVGFNKCTVCGGGAKSPLWKKILANVLNTELISPSFEEGPAYGGAILAMVANREFPSVSAACESLVSYKGSVMPTPRLVALYEEKYKKYKKIYPAVKSLYKELKI